MRAAGQLGRGFIWIAACTSVVATAAGAVAVLVTGVGPGWLRGGVAAMSVVAVAVILAGLRQQQRSELRGYVDDETSLAREAGAGAGAQPVDELATREFEELVERALQTIPAEFREKMTNVEIAIEDEPPADQPWGGSYQGLPLTARNARGWLWPDKIRIYRGPLVRHYAGDRARLETEVRRIVLHEIAHHFGISDERLIEISRH